LSSGAVLVRWSGVVPWLAGVERAKCPHNGVACFAPLSPPCLPVAGVPRHTGIGLGPVPTRGFSWRIGGVTRGTGFAACDLIVPPLSAARFVTIDLWLRGLVPPPATLSIPAASIDPSLAARRGPTARAAALAGHRPRWSLVGTPISLPAGALALCDGDGPRSARDRRYRSSATALRGAPLGLGGGARGASPCCLESCHPSLCLIGIGPRGNPWRGTSPRCLFCQSPRSFCGPRRPVVAVRGARQAASLRSATFAILAGGRVGGPRCGRRRWGCRHAGRDGFAGLSFGWRRRFPDSAPPRTSLGTVPKTVLGPASPGSFRRTR